MGRWRVHRWTLLAGNGQSQMLCQFRRRSSWRLDRGVMRKLRTCPALAGSALGVPPLPVFHRACNMELNEGTCKERLLAAIRQKIGRM